MAIFQISQITNRKGKQIDLPQLAGGELGWSVDTRQLWIGNGSLEEGAPIVGNTEILTEFSDILSVATAYTYKGLAAGYTAQTGPTPSTPVEVSLQNWMDQWASVKDFGAVGDGVADDTAAINRALYQIYCREVNPQIRRSLYFPAGIYRITDSILIPPYATLYGEGINNSMIVADSSATSLLYVFRTCDSLQQSGAQIGSNNAIPPQNITISDMGFGTNAVGSNVFLIQDASNVFFESVKFFGPYNESDLTTSDADVACVRFASTPTLVTNNITFSSCIFSNATYAINTRLPDTDTDQQVRSVTVTQNKINIVYQGVVLGSSPLVIDGPTGFSISENIFQSSYAEGVYIGLASLNATGFNLFYDVGNHFLGIDHPYTACISIESSNNVSIGDMFLRPDAQSSGFSAGYTWPPITLNGTSCIAFTNSSQIAVGTYVRQSGQKTTLLNNVIAPTDIFSINTSMIPSFSLEYNIIRGGIIRKGVLTSIIPVAPATDMIVTDDYTENSTSGITLSVSLVLDNATLQYTSTDAIDDAIMTYSLTYLN